MKYDIITMKYIFKYFDFCPPLLKNTAPAPVCARVRECVCVGSGGSAARLIPPSGEKHIKKKRQTTQRLSFPPPPLLRTPPPLDLRDKIEKKIRQKEKERKRKALKPPDLSKLLRLSAKITSAGYLLAPQISWSPSPFSLKMMGFMPLFYFLIISPLCSLLELERRGEAEELPVEGEGGGGRQGGEVCRSRWTLVGRGGGARAARARGALCQRLRGFPSPRLAHIKYLLCRGDAVVLFFLCLSEKPRCGEQGRSWAPGSETSGHFWVQFHTPVASDAF